MKQERQKAETKTRSAMAPQTVADRTRFPRCRRAAPRLEGRGLKVGGPHRGERQATTPSLKTKRISPHTIRHTTAVHLLRAGVDINTIRACLGHVSLETTNRYAQIDLEMKAAALETCAVRETETADNQGIPLWLQDRELMDFLTIL